MGEERVVRRMRRQHGLVTRAQALEDGMTKRQIDHRLARLFDDLVGSSTPLFLRVSPGDGACPVADLDVPAGD